MKFLISLILFFNFPIFSAFDPVRVLVVFKPTLTIGSLLNNKFALTYAYKGLALGEQGKINDALKHFKKALSIDKDLELANISKETALRLLDSKKN